MLLPDAGQLGPERADFFLVLLTNLAMLVFELIERLTNDVQFVDLRGHCRDTLGTRRAEIRKERGLTTGVGLFLCASEDCGVLKDSVELLADGIERVVEACMATREADGRLLDRLIGGTLGLQLLVLLRRIARGQTRVGLEGEKGIGTL